MAETKNDWAFAIARMHTLKMCVLGVYTNAHIPALNMCVYTEREKDTHMHACSSVYTHMKHYSARHKEEEEKLARIRIIRIINKAYM